MWHIMILCLIVFCTEYCFQLLTVQTVYLHVAVGNYLVL